MFLSSPRLNQMLWFKFGESIHLRNGAIMNHKIECEKQHWTKKMLCSKCWFRFNWRFDVDVKFAKDYGRLWCQCRKKFSTFSAWSKLHGYKNDLKTKSSSKWTTEIKSFPITKKEAMYCKRRETKTVDVMCVKDVVFRMIANSNSSRNKNIRNLLKYWAIIHYIVLSI